MSAAADRIDDLLAQRATEGLSDEASAELEQALQANPGLDGEALDRAAAAANIALISARQALPAHLRAAIQRDAAQFFGGPSKVASSPIRPSEHRPAPWPWLAAAAALVLAIAGWWPQGDIAVRPASLSTQYAELLAANALELNWTATEDATAVGASGTVLWDQATQKGFMRFSGLAANDPSQFQYQLWIFDAARGEQYPVDGGVFDIPAGETEITVPIDSRLPIDQAILFAVTVERPGGVVVSSRERIAVLAEVS